MNPTVEQIVEFAQNVDFIAFQRDEVKTKAKEQADKEIIELYNRLVKE